MRCDRNPSGVRPGHMAGFTLVELMVVVAIIGILAAIAYPSYTAYLVKARRTAATTCLQQNAQFMERYYTTNLSYAGAPAPQICDPDLNGFYTISFSGAPTARTYTIQAVPTGRQNDGACGTLTLNERGVRTKSGSAASAADCW
jgi:type IV pilus assembly protein PilE